MSSRLLPDSKTLDEIRVSFGTFALEVIQESSPLPDEHEQPTAGVVIFGVCLEVLGQVADALAENCDLNLW